MSARNDETQPSGNFRARFQASVLGRLLLHPFGRVGIAILTVMCLAAVFAEVIAPFDPATQDSMAELAPPSAAHWLGTDQFGRDILSRVIYGTRIAILVGGVAAIVGCFIGVLLGLVAGYYGGAIDSLTMRLVDVLLAFPGVLIALLLVVVWGTGLTTISIALAVGSIPVFSRLTRASVLQLKEREYVLAARSFGSSGLRIMLQHLLRNSTSPIVVQLGLVIGISVLTESSLSFLGLGIQPPTASWGLMLNESRIFLYNAPWFAIAPGTALTLFLVGLVLLSDALRDVLDVGELIEGGSA